MSNLIYTSEADARAWGATHWSLPPDEGDFPQLAVLLREDGRDECPECGQVGALWQPINQEGGPGPACGQCLDGLGWTAPEPLPCPHPTHVSIS